MALITDTYCTQIDMNRMLSTQGVTDYSDNDQDGLPDTETIDEAINWASQELEALVRQQYTQARMKESPLVNRWCTVVSCYFLGMTRGNPPPDIFQAQFDRIMTPETGLAWLCAKGRYALPGIPRRADLRPTWDNMKVDRRFPQRKQRTVRSISSDAPTVLRQDSVPEFF